MRQLQSLILIEVVGLALLNNFPALNVAVILPAILFAVSLYWFSNGIERLFVFVIVILIYGGLSGDYELAGSVGFVALSLLYLNQRFSLPLITLGPLTAFFVQAVFFISASVPLIDVALSFSVQLIVIIGISIMLEKGARSRGGIESISNL